MPIQYHIHWPMSEKSRFVKKKQNIEQNTHIFLKYYSVTVYEIS